MTRFLYLYVNKQPGENLDPLRREFIKFIYSQEGQKVTLRDGFLPVPAEVVAQSLKEVGIDPEQFLRSENEVD